MKKICGVTMAVMMAVSVFSETRTTDKFNKLKYAWHDSTLTITGSGDLLYINSPVPFFDIKSIVIGDSITHIGSFAFDNPYLKNITIGKGVFSIAGYAFNHTGIESIVIPDNVKHIDANIFAGASSLVSIYIGAGVERRRIYGPPSFSDCDRLKEISVSPSNSYYSSLDGVFYNKNKTALLTYPESKETPRFTVPESVTILGANAFKNATLLTSVIIPDNASIIGNYAFAHCEALTSLTIGNDVTSIGKGAFIGCRKLASVSIPDSAGAIGNYAFSDCEALTSLTIGNHVTSIGEGAFFGCKKLASVSIPGHVTTIGDYAFASCFGLQTIVIPDNVVWLGNGVFKNCSNLVSISLPRGISLGKDVFWGCDKLKNIEWRENVSEND